MQVHTFKTQEERLNSLYEQYGWNGKFFLLTRDLTDENPVIEITTIGGGFGDVDICYRE